MKASDDNALVLAAMKSSKVFAAYARDRAAQYDHDRYERHALEEFAALLDAGEAVEALKHGEIDDLVRR